LHYVSIDRPFMPGAIAALLSLGLWQLGSWQFLEQQIYNALFQIRESLPRSGWDSRIAAIVIDEATLQQYQQFPLKRDRYTQLLDVLSDAPPATIGFDILFIEPSPEDAEFAAAMAANGRVVLASAWNEAGEPLQPNPQLQQSAAGVGQIVHQPDSDGISREATAFVGGFPGLSLVMLDVYNVVPETDPVDLPTPEFAQELQNVWVNWPGKAEALATYSFAAVAEGEVPATALADKLVLVGIDVVGADPLKTPLNQRPSTAGVYLHAALLDNVLNQQGLRKLPESLTLLLLLAVGPLTSWLLFGRKLQGRMVAALMLPLVWFAIALTAFSAYRWWLPVAAPLGTMLLAGIGIQLREQYEKQQLMSLFGKHVSPEMARLIWQQRSDIFQEGKLEAQELVATVMFSDIRGFTSISEKLAPRELLNWLNLYLDQMGECIISHGGTIDKYIGDAIMAVFGMPIARTTLEEIRADAANAIAAGLAMQQQLKLLNQQLQEEGQPTIQCGIGIHTGTIVAGSVGGAKRLNYSAIGDAVNVAARLEAMNKTIDTGNPYNLLITSETYEHASDLYHARPVGSMQLRGREQETVICAVLGERERGTGNRE